jgi:AraC family ethanolamine operon transcriptional activator
VSAYIGKGHEHLMFLADRALLRRRLSEAQLQILERADREHVLPGSPLQVDGLRAWALRSLRQFRARPETLNHPAAVQALEDDYIQWLCAAIDAIAPVAAKRLNPALRELGVKRALEYLRSAGNGAVTVPSLCEGIGVSQRTLQYAFRETFGVSPLGYLRLQRLHAVRRQLMLGSRGETTVATVACEHGFYELGRFAAIYAKTFGERPSETLSRQFRISGHVFSPDTTGNNKRF